MAATQSRQRGCASASRQLASAVTQAAACSMSDPDVYDEGSELSSAEPTPTLWERLGDAARASASAAAAGAAAAATGVRDGAEAVRDGWNKGAQRADKWAANGVVRRQLPVLLGGLHCGGQEHTSCPCAPHRTTSIALGCLVQVGRAFQFKQRNAKFTTELRAGLITFLMASDSAASGCCHLHYLLYKPAAVCQPITKRFACIESWKQLLQLAQLLLSAGYLPLLPIDLQSDPPHRLTALVAPALPAMCAGQLHPGSEPNHPGHHGRHM